MLITQQVQNTRRSNESEEDDWVKRGFIAVFGKIGKTPIILPPWFLNRSQGTVHNQIADQGTYYDFI